MDFITIDFETATTDRSTPCEIGLTFVERNQIVETKSWLIKPHCYPTFDFFNTFVHKITPNDVSNAPDFKNIWDSVLPLIHGKLLIAHNASFDFSVLRKTLDIYDLPYPDVRYACSYIMAKNIWKGISSYNLKSLCNYKNIEFNHHRAAADSNATAKLLLNAFQELNVTSDEDFKTKLHVDIGRLSVSDYRPCRKIKVYTKSDSSTPNLDTSNFNIDCIFYNRKVVFTGKLSSMERSAAHNIVLSIGGSINDRVTNDTNYLVVGQQDYRYVGESGMSSKQKKAINMVENQADIEILSEEDFLKSIDNKNIIRRVKT